MQSQLFLGSECPTHNPKDEDWTLNSKPSNFDEAGENFDYTLQGWNFKKCGVPHESYCKETQKVSSVVFPTEQTQSMMNVIKFQSAVDFCVAVKTVEVFMSQKLTEAYAKSLCNQTFGIGTLWDDCKKQGHNVRGDLLGEKVKLKNFHFQGSELELEVEF